MKVVTLEQVRAELEILEKLVDGYHRKIKAGIEPDYSHSQLCARVLMIGYNLQEVNHGNHMTMRDPFFQRLMVTAKLLDQMKYDNLSH